MPMSDCAADGLHISAAENAAELQAIHSAEHNASKNKLHNINKSAYA